MEKRKFAAFDIDGTIIRWQLFHAIVIELTKSGHIPEHVNDRVREARMTWKKRDNSNSYHDYESTLIEEYTAILQSMTPSDIDTAAELVFETYKDQVYTYTRDLIHTLKEQNYVLIAISGSMQEVVSKLGNYYGFDHVIGTRYARDGDAFTGEQFVPIITGKDIILKSLVEKHNLSWEGSLAIGDTASDIPMLELVQRPIAFNPNQELISHAKDKGWNIAVERKNVVYELKHDGSAYILA